MDGIVRLTRMAGATAALLLLGACAGTPATDTAARGAADRSAPATQRAAPASRNAGAGSSERVSATARGTITRVATDMIGVPYRYGGTSPSDGFDCSGLVFYSYAEAGLRVPRNSMELYKAAEKIPLERAVSGDLVFFQDQRKLSHVGIYLGGNRFVHAPSSGSTVRVSTLDSAYYQRHLVGVGRLIED